jgi:hypothetical protein
MYEFTAIHGHMRQDLRFLLRQDESMKQNQRKATTKRSEITYSAKLFSTNPRNLTLALARTVSSSL